MADVIGLAVNSKGFSSSSLLFLSSSSLSSSQPVLAPSAHKLCKRVISYSVSSAALAGDLVSSIVLRPWKNWTSLKFQKIQEAIELHITARCSIGPPKGVRNLTIESLYAPKDAVAGSSK